MTACWTRSHTGQRYPYYLCQYRGCTEKGKSIRREKLETEFGELLIRLVPAQATLSLAEKMFRDAWEERSGSASAEAKRLKAKVRQIEVDIEKTVQRLVQTQNETVISAYEARIEELKKEEAVISEEVVRTAAPLHTFDEMFELTMRFLASPYRIWEKATWRRRELS